MSASDVNKFSVQSTRSSQLESGTHREVTHQHERKLILSLVDKIFEEKRGLYTVTSPSSCSTDDLFSPESDYDKRLKYWKDTLRERQRIAQNIQNAVGRAEHDVLFHRSTVMDQEKNMVKRVLDLGERMNPLKLLTKRVLTTRDRCNLVTMQAVSGLSATLPKPEKEKKAEIEIVGIPRFVKEEQFGYQPPCKKSAWLESKALEESIQKNRADIERIVEFYPDIDNLEVVGESLFKNITAKHDSDIKLLNEDVIKTVSTETSTPIDECKCEVKVIKEDQPIINGIKVNEHVYIAGTKRSAQHVEIEVRFDCYPFEKVKKRVLHLENIGKKILNIEFSQRNYYHKMQPLLRSQDDEFVMDFQPFRLISGEKRDIVVMYQPRKVDIVKQQWILKLDAQFFCRKADAIVLKLSGRCKPPLLYMQKINSNLHNVIEKSNLKMISKLGNHLGNLVPLIKPDEAICPYTRILNERELFEQLNPSYVCERYHDLDLLKGIHKRIKKPREPAWDLDLNTLFNQILRLDSPDERALFFNEALGILEDMKGKPVELESKVELSPERERTRFLYVRGVLCASIEEWETMIIGVQDTFINQTIKIHRTRADEKKDDGAGGDKPHNPEEALFNLEQEKLHQALLRRVYRQKPFRDSIFVITYTHVCNFIEDIVSVIESAEFV